MRFSVLFGCLARLLECPGGVFVRLARKLVGSQAALAVRSGGGGMRVCSQVVQLGGSVVNALGHGYSPLCHWMPGKTRAGETAYRPIHPPSTVSTVPVT